MEERGRFQSANLRGSYKDVQYGKGTERMRVTMNIICRDLVIHVQLIKGIYLYGRLYLFQMIRRMYV